MDSEQAAPAAPSRWRRVRFSFESLGWRRALLETATGRWPYDPAADRRFDARHGTATAGSVEPDHLGIDDPGARAHAILYLPSPPSVTTWMLDRLERDPAFGVAGALDRVTFVDLGCGKGRVVLLAAGRPFGRVLGVEISAELAATARRNVAAYRPPPPLIADVDVVEADVTAMELPTTDLVLHLYHPFEPPVTAAVLRRLGDSLVTMPRRVVVAYLSYTHAVVDVDDTIRATGWLRRVRYEQSARGHYNWLLYTNA